MTLDLESSHNPHHPESIEYINTGKLPAHFSEARRFFREDLLPNNEWYTTNQNKYVAILGEEILVDDDPDALLQRAYEQWGKRPIYTAKVTRERKVVKIRPRAIRRRPN